MPSVATVSLVGRLTRDPESKASKTGKQIVSFSVAVNNGPRDNQTVAYYDVACFSPFTQEKAERLSKGSLTHVTGKLVPESYQGRDGSTKFALKVYASELLPLESSSQGGSETAQADIPF